MFKKASYFLFISVFLLVGCSSKLEQTESKTKTELSESTKSSDISFTNNKKDSSKEIILSNTTLNSSKYSYLGNLLFFSNPSKNNNLSVAKINNNDISIIENSIIDSFNYSVNAITTLNGIIYFSSTTQQNKGIYKLDYEKNTIVKLIDTVSSSLIAYNNKLYYLNSSDKHLYSYDIKSNSITLLSNNRASKFIFNNNYIFYENLDDNSKLYSLHIDGTHKLKLTDVSVDSFITYNSGILFFDISNDNTLSFLDLPLNKITNYPNIKGYDLKQYNDDIYFINIENPNSLYKLLENEDTTVFESSLVLSEFVNDYFLTEEKIFIEKASNPNKIEILNIE
jgi:Domain of unknown function (DUF5050)